MRFWKLDIVLVVLVFSFDHIRSAPADDYADSGANDADEGVDDTDQGVNDADEAVDDADEAVDDTDEGVSDGIVEPDDVAVEGKDCPDASHDDDVNNVADHKALPSLGLDKSGPIKKLELNDKQKEAIVAQCKQGHYFYIDGCNICYCYGEGTQGCTDILCNKDKKTRLLGNPKESQTYKKLRGTATGCVPGETFVDPEANNCACRCVLPSVMTCEKKCLVGGFNPV